MRSAAVVFFILVLAASAQQVGGNASPETGDTPSFRTSTQLVIETLVVRDKSGRPIKGLTAKDFMVAENGVPQEIRFFDYQKLPDAPSTPPAGQAGPEHVRIYDRLGPTQISPEAPGKTRYKDRRLLALYFDMTAMPTAEQFRALAAAEKFIGTEMASADLMAIFRYSGAGVEVLQDFTEDRDRLLSTLQTMVVGEGQGFDESTEDAGTPDTGAAFGQDDSEFNIFNTDRQLSALQTAAQMLGRLSEKKSLIYFAGGLRLNGLNNQAQLQATINTAIRAGVSFWPIDARGLKAVAPLGDATQDSPGGVAMYSGAAALAFTTGFQQSQDTFYALAADTGGKALLDYNDLAKGILQAERSVPSYYILGYYTTNTAQDGRFRRIKISLNEDLSAKLDYRQGYFAGKQFSKFTASDKERQLEDALMLPDPITELTIAMEIDYFQLNRAEYFVPVAVKIPGRELALARRGGAERTLIDFIGEIKDNYGVTVTNVRDKLNIKLSDTTAEELARRPIEYDTGFTLLPGKYSIKFLARDAETGRIGTWQTTFVIPNLNLEERRLPISSVVLGSQRVRLNDALYKARKDDDREEAANPLVRNGQKLIPSVTRVFSKGRDLHIYLQAYERAAPAIRPLIAFVGFYHGRQKAFESGAIEVLGGTNARLPTVPIQLDIPLASLAPARYDCQVTVLDPEGHKAAFWQAPVVIVP